MHAGKGTSRMRCTKKGNGCIACGRATCCDCCSNWCHICGVAKCRVTRPSKWQADTLNTQYKRDYPPKHADVERRIPGHPPLASMPFSGQTTHRADFTPKKARSQSARPADVPIPAHCLDDSTSYKTHYPPKRADLEAPPKAPLHRWTAPFLGKSTYNADYVPRKVRPWTAEPTPLGPSVPLEGVSEYKDKFPAKPLPPPTRRVAQRLLPSSHVPTITTYGQDYVPKPFEARERLHCCDDPRHPGEPQWTVRRRYQERPCSTCSSDCCPPEWTAAMKGLTME